MKVIDFVPRVSETNRLETISKMVLDKQGERPMLIVVWGRFLKMFLEVYPESRPIKREADDVI